MRYIRCEISNAYVTSRTHTPEDSGRTKFYLLGFIYFHQRNFSRTMPLRPSIENAISVLETKMQRTSLETGSKQESRMHIPGNLAAWFIKWETIASLNWIESVRTKNSKLLSQLNFVILYRCLKYDRQQRIKNAWFTKWICMRNFGEKITRG